MIRRFTVATKRGPRDVEVVADEDATAGAILATVGIKGDTHDDTGATVHRMSPAELIRNGSTLAGAVRESPADHELWVVAGTEGGTRYALTDGTWSLGRDPSCDIVLPDRTVSSSHASINVTSEGIAVCDLGSSNGTFVDGTRVGPDEVALASGSVVRFGDAAVVAVRQIAPDGVVRRDPKGRALFNITPRRIDDVDALRVSLPTPPTKGEPLSLGSNLAMAGTTAVGSVVMALISHRPELLAFGALAPIQFLITGVLSRRRQQRREAGTSHGYESSLATAHQRIQAYIGVERDRAEQAAPNMAEISRIASGPTSRLWERPPVSPDYLTVRLGIGARPSIATIQDQGTDAHPLIPDAPIELNLTSERVTGIHGPANKAMPLARWVLTQIAVLHSPSRLQIIVLTSTDGERDWGWTRWLPHVASDDGIRVASTDDQTRSALETLTNTIEDVTADLARNAGPPPVPSIVVLVDRPHRLGASPQLARLLGDGPLAGIVTICVAPSRQEQRSECTANVGIDQDNRLDLDWSGAKRLTDPVGETLPVALADQIARAIAWLEVGGATTGRGTAMTYPLQYRDVDQHVNAASLAERWNARPASTQFAFGRTETAVQDLDLIADGPHILVAGTAGSGKSELVQTMIAGLAIANRPDQLNFALFDFKGGACFGAGVRLPHTTSVTLNLDGSAGVLRAVKLIRAELTWREERFREASQAQSLDDYRRNRTASQPVIARLIVVIDEFARFVDAVPNVITTFIEIGRIGRSLGVHLLLATQSPRNCVTPELRSNVQTVIGLRTANDIESSLILGSGEAARLSAFYRGRGYVASPNAPLTLFQTAWIGAPARSDDVAPTVTARELIWSSLGAPPSTEPIGTHERKQFDVLAEDMRATWAAECPGLPPLRAPLPPELPTDLSPDQLARVPGGVLPIGLEDRIARQDQIVAGIVLDAGSHVLIAGSGGSGRTTAIRAIALGAAAHLGARQCQINIIDLGSNRLSDLEELPGAGSVLTNGDDYLVGALLEQLSTDVQARQRLLRDHKVDRFTDLPPDRPPYLLLLVDNWPDLARIVDRDPRLHDRWESVLDKGRAVGLVVVVAGDETLSIREILSRFDERYLLSFNDENSFARFEVDLHAIPATMPKGRAIRMRTGNEVQLVRYPADWSTAPHGERQPRTGSRQGVQRLPATVALASLPLKPQGPLVVTLGVGGFDAAVVQLDLQASGPAFAISGPPRSGKSTALVTIGSQLITSGCRVVVIAGRKSPLTPGSFEGALHPQQGLREAIDALEADDPNAPVVLIADDPANELLEDPDLNWFLATTSRAALVALRWDDARSLRQHTQFGLTLRRNPNGLLLMPVPGSSMPPLGIEVPRDLSLGGHEGRGWLVEDGELTVIQVAK